MEAQVPETVPGPKRIAPTLIAPIRISESPEPEPEPTKRKNSARSSKYYLPLKGRKIETLFYEQPVKADIDLESDENDSNFVAPGLTNFPGERRYVGRRITRFLKDNSQIIDDIQSDRHFATGSASGQLVRVTTEDNQIRYAVKHYGNPDRFLRKYENQSFTVFDFGPSGVKAHRESNKTLKLPWPTANQTKAAIASNSDIQIVRHADRPKNSPPALDLDSNSNHDWDYLLKWNNIDGGDKILPVFGESDDENEYDSETWKEIQAENGPQSKALKSRHQKYLSPDEIKEAIEESIQELVLKWREKVLPKKEATAYRVWRKAKKEKNHRANIKAAQDGIKPLDERISKIREELLKSSMNWTKKDLVRKQVRGSMLQTVMDREDLKWYIKLMGRKEAPAKPLKKVQKPKRVDQQGNELPQENEEEADNEEEIGSSSDEDGFSEDEGDEMDGFIIGDPITLDDPMDTGPDEKDEGDEVSSVTAKTPQKSKLGKRTVVEDSQGDHDVPMSDVVDDYPMTNVMDDAPMPDASDGARYREKGTPDKIKDESKTPGPTVAASPAGTQVFIDLTTSTPSRYSTRDGITVIELESSEDEGDQPTPTPTQSKGKGKALVKEKKKRNQNREYLPESDSEGDGVSESGPGEEDEPVGKDDPVGEDGPSEKNDQGSDSDSADQLVQRYQMLNEMVVEDSESDNYPAFFHLQDVPAITIFDNQMIELQRVSFKNKTKRNGPPVRRLTRLYIAWTFLKKDATGHEKLPNSDLKILKQKNNFFVFLDHLWKILKNTYPKLVASSDTGRDVDFTTSAKPSFGISGSGGAGDSQHRKRKRKEVKEDPNAKATRQQAQHQAKIIQERRELARERGEEVGGGNVVVNYGHKEDLKDILIPEEIAKWGLKPHQITGIQFLWEQVVMGNQEAKLERCGGLLAHTMGLGKTLQV